MSEPSRPIPGSTGAVLTELPSPYAADPVFGLLHLPRFLAKIRYVHTHGELPASYRKNFCRGFDRFLCLHLGVDPKNVVERVQGLSQSDALASLRDLFPQDVAAPKWNRELVQKGMTEAGQEFLLEALSEMGCPDRAADIKSVADLIDFDEGRIR